MRVLQRAIQFSRRSPTRLLSASASSRYADPFLLPNTPEHLVSTVTEDILPTPLHRTNESVDTLRARLIYQSRKRGILENDLLLGTFARDNLYVMNEEEMMEYDKLLDEQDWDIYYWATEKRAPSKRWSDSTVLKKLTLHARNKGKVMRSMPPL